MTNGIIKYERIISSLPKRVNRVSGSTFTFMSLNWQFTDKNRFQKLSDSDNDWNGAFIWGCLITDMRDITEKNAEEWRWRYAYAVNLNGPSYYRPDGTPFIPSKDEVNKRIGLTTNCSQRTRKQFVDKQNRIYSSLAEQSSR
jgi:hypothetical protein